MKFSIKKDYYEENIKLYDKTTVDIKEGITVLCGCNGSGKTTLLKQIKDQLYESGVHYLSYDNMHDGGNNAKSKAAFYNQIDLFANLLMSSEGEEIRQNFGVFVADIGKFIRVNRKEKEIFILIDGADSGVSIDILLEQIDIFNVIIDDCKSYGINIYIIISTNQYEITKYGQCLDVMKLKYINNFNSYEKYKSFILKSREKKDKRYENIGE